MKRYTLLGDVHGDIEICSRVCRADITSTVIQIGDFGIGFVNPDVLFERHNGGVPENFRFFVGNHDDRDKANTIPYCLGDYGEFGPFFFVSGADSIDKNDRIPGWTWWDNEELNYDQCNRCLDQWVKSDKEILLCHDCPQSIAEAYMMIYEKSRTRVLLQDMIEARKPKAVYFGHHHRELKVEHNGIQYRCIDINEPVKITA